MVNSGLGKGKCKMSLEYLVVQNCKTVQEKNEDMSGMQNAAQVGFH